MELSCQTLRTTYQAREAVSATRPEGYASAFLWRPRVRAVLRMLWELRPSAQALGGEEDRVWRLRGLWGLCSWLALTVGVSRDLPSRFPALCRGEVYLGLCAPPGRSLSSPQLLPVHFMAKTGADPAEGNRLRISWSPISLFHKSGLYSPTLPPSHG